MPLTLLRPCPASLPSVDIPFGGALPGYLLSPSGPAGSTNQAHGGAPVLSVFAALKSDRSKTIIVGAADDALPHDFLESAIVADDRFSPSRQFVTAAVEGQLPALPRPSSSSQRTTALRPSWPLAQPAANASCPPFLIVRSNRGERHRLSARAAPSKLKIGSTPIVESSVRASGGFDFWFRP